MIGRAFGRYRVVAALGEGGMGSVWRAQDPVLGRDVALKLLSPALLGSDAARERFWREARAASQLDHPNVATVYDVGEADGQVWIATQLIEGESLARRCATGPLPAGRALMRDVEARIAELRARYGARVGLKSSGVRSR